MHEGKGNQTERNQHQAYRDQFRFAHLFDHSADRATLDEGAHNSAISEKEPNCSCVFSGASIEVKVLCDEEAECCFEAGEAKGREEKNRYQQPDLRQSECVCPLG